MGKKLDARTLQISERRDQVIQLRRAGLSIRDIAARVNADPKTVHADIKTMLADAIRENVDNADQLRALEIERLDRVMLGLSPLVFPSKGGATPDLKAVDRYLRISEQRARLLGLYAPVKQDVQVSGALSWKQMLDEAQQEMTDGGAGEHSS